eukprot:363859-Chlamydomonas_euryale.AAC.4
MAVLGQCRWFLGMQGKCRWFLGVQGKCRWFLSGERGQSRFDGRTRALCDEPATAWDTSQCSVLCAVSLVQTQVSKPPPKKGRMSLPRSQNDLGREDLDQSRLTRTGRVLDGYPLPL